MRVRLLLAALLMVPVGFTRSDEDARRAPKYATITAACNPSGNPSVQPAQVLMTRADNVEWREPSGRAAAWVITPKEAQRWPFPEAIAGTQKSPADSGPPDPTAADGTYGYTVTITCADGSTQVIDPEIIIGAS